VDVKSFFGDRQVPLRVPLVAAVGLIENTAKFLICNFKYKGTSFNNFQGTEKKCRITAVPNTLC